MRSVLERADEVLASGDGWHRAPAAPLGGRANRARLRLARMLGLSASRMSRLSGLGAGSTVGGRVLLAVDPGALPKLAAGRQVALVSGTNGKSTTRVMLTAALGTAGTTVSNVCGANLRDGVALALSRRPSAARAVLEVDEYVLADVLLATKPSVVVLLNLSRDQLDRVGEVRRVASRWRAALAGSEAMVVANAEDPNVVWAVGDCDATWVSPGTSWTADAAVCPNCGGVVVYSQSSSDWGCRCGLGRPTTRWQVDGKAVIDPVGGRHLLSLQLPGRANRADAAFALVAASVLGVAPASSLRSLAGVSSVEGRYAVHRFRGREVRLLLAKNPAGAAAALEVMRPPPAPAVLAINAQEPDGRDTSWLWDAPFERLRGRPVVVSGERAEDAAVRLKYAGVAAQVAESLSTALLAGDRTLPVDVVANYTAFQQVRRLVGDG